MVLRLGEHLPIDHFLLDHLRQCLNPQAHDHLGLRLANVGVGFGQLGDGHLHVALGHDDQLLGLLHLSFVQLDQCDHSFVFLLQFGNEYLRQHLPLFHLLTNVHVRLLDETGYLGENRGLLVSIHKAGLIDRVIDGPQLRLDDVDHDAVPERFVSACCSISAAGRQGGQHRQPK